MNVSDFSLKRVETCCLHHCGELFKTVPFVAQQLSW